MEETITLTKKEFDSRIGTTSMLSIGFGAMGVGISLLFDKKIEKTTGWGIAIGGAIVMGVAIAFRQIDKMKTNENK